MKFASAFTRAPPEIECHQPGINPTPQMLRRNVAFEAKRVEPMLRFILKAYHHGFPHAKHPQPPNHILKRC
jgi:hypothetical protein